MKKSVVAMLTSALVVGATATTFAAANPFSDVPAGHWAYNAVTRLASEGVIEGYGDGTYRGNRNITRYEMAQMVARALAKTPTANISSSARGDLDKLAAEFRDELDSLGVRVAELEKHSDMVKWAGKIEWTYGQLRQENAVGTKVNSMGHGGVFRLEPEAEVANHWKAIARFDAGFDTRNDSTNDVKLKRVYAQGDYDKFGVKIGRFGFCPAVEDGLVADTVVSGGELSFGSKWKFIVTAGRIGADSDEAHYYNYDKDNDSAKTWLGQAVAVARNGLSIDDNGNVDPSFNIKSDGRLYNADGSAVDIPVRDATTLATAGRVAAEGGSIIPSVSSLKASYEASIKSAFQSAYNATVAGYDDPTSADAIAAGQAAGRAAATTALNNAIDTEYANALKNYDTVVQNTHPTDVVALNLQYDPGETGLYGGASYYYGKDKDFKNYFYSDNADTDKANIWAVNLGYRMSDALDIWGSYAQNSKADNEDYGWQADIRYGNYGDYSNAGDWAVWAGYARFGYNVALGSSQSDDVQTGTKGWHVGAAYAPFKNVGLLARYSDGKWITSGDKYRKIFGRVEFFF